MSSEIVGFGLFVSVLALVMVLFASRLFAAQKPAERIDGERPYHESVCGALLGESAHPPGTVSFAMYQAHCLIRTQEESISLKYADIQRIERQQLGLVSGVRIFHNRTDTYPVILLRCSAESGLFERLAVVVQQSGKDKTTG